MTTLLDAALGYAARGWRVHPLHTVTPDSACSCERDDCESPGKHPRLSAWQKKATTDADAIRAWWRRWPGAGIGVATGDGLFVVDLDGDDGDASMRGLIDAHGSIPETWAVATRRGAHLYFAIEGRQGNGAGVLPGIDLRGDGGYVVAPPTLHAEGAYSVACDAPVAPIPPWLLAALVKPVVHAVRPAAPVAVALPDDAPHARRYAAAALDAEARAVAEAAEGQRNARLSRAAYAIGGYVGAGALDAGHAVDVLAHAGRAAGLGDREAEDVARRQVAAGAEAPRSIPPPKLRLAPPPTDDEPEEEEATDAPAPAPVEPISLDALRRLAPAKHRAAAKTLDRSASTGTARPTALNVRRALAMDPRIGPHLWRDSVTRSVYLGADELAEEHSIAIAMWLDHAYHLRVGRQQVDDALLVLAGLCERNPLADWLGGLRWDGTGRLDRWLIDGFGSPPCDLHRLYARRWMVGAVARAMVPGCQLDTVLVLVGEQGARKSTALRALVGADWYSDSHIDLASKDGLIALRRPWVHELAELASLASASGARIKGIITSAQDSYRPPFGRDNQRFPRRCILAGTTNEPRFLADSTGERRWWPVKTGDDVDIEWVRDRREQLWAEAVAAYQAGERWWFERREELALRFEALAAYREIDPWEEIIANYLTDIPLHEVTLDAVCGAIGLTARDRDLRASRRIGGILRGIGYESVPTHIEGRSVRVYRRIGQDAP